MKSLIIIVLFACLVGSGITKTVIEEFKLANLEFKPVRELPADIPTCSETNGNLNECLKDAFQMIIPRIKNGIKELNIPPMDPFVLERSSYQHSNGIVQGRVVMKNVRVYGLSEATIEKVNFELKDGHVRMDMTTHVPNLLIEGNYKADMKFNDVKMSPKGYFNVTMTDITMRAQPEGELYEREGHSYLRLTKFDSDPDVGDMRIWASGLFPDPTLNAVILDFVNQYWRQIYKSLLPETRETWEPFMINMANEFLASIPFDLFITKN